METLHGKIARFGDKYIVCYIDKNNALSFLESPSVPENFMEINNPHIERELEEYILNKKRQQYPFLFYTRKDLVRMVNEKIENPTKIHYAAAITFLMLKIASLFQENPELVFDIPLYEEYIQTHNLNRDEFGVEDFIGSLEDVIGAIEDSYGSQI